MRTHTYTHTETLGWCGLNSKEILKLAFATYILKVICKKQAQLSVKCDSVTHYYVVIIINWIVSATYLRDHIYFQDRDEELANKNSMFLPLGYIWASI